MKPVLTLCLSLTILFASGQKEANIWHFSGGVRLDFNYTPDSLNTSLTQQTPVGSSTWCDTLGQLMFYSNGETVYNRNDQVLDNGANLIGHRNSTQSALFVPHPGKSNQFYLFTTNANGSGNLAYSIIDTSYNNGLGKVLPQYKNTVILSSTTEKLTVIPHLNGVDYWIIGHKYGNNSFYVWQLTKLGLSQTPIIQNYGTSLNSGSNSARGFLKPSLDGTLIANACFLDKKIEVYKFNASTGILSPHLVLNTGFVFGVAFSKYNRFLYGSNWGTSLDDLVQFDISSGDSAIVNNSETIIGYLEGEPGDIQYLPDLSGMYVIKRSFSFSLKYVGKIRDPDSLGLKSNYTDSSLYLNTSHIGGLGLSNIIQGKLHKPPLKFSNICSGDSTIIQILDYQNLDSLQLKFGDGSSVLLDSVQKLVKHKYSSAGLYKIDLTFFKGNDSVHLEQNILISDYPDVDLGNDTSLCNEKSLRIDKSQSNALFLWNDGSKTPFKFITTNGRYSLRIEKNGCVASDTIDVNFRDLPTPNLRDTSICAYDSIELSIVCDSVIWFDQIKDSKRMINEAKFYTYNAWLNQCQITDSIRVSHRITPQVHLGYDTTLCKGDTLFLQNKHSHPYTYLWNTGATDSIIPIKNTGMYYATARDSFCAASDTIQVTFQEIPNVYAADSVFYCQAGNALVEITYPLDTLIWYDGENKRTRLFNVPGYVYFSFDDGVCQGDDTIELVGLLPPVLFTLGDDTTLCLGDSLSIGTTTTGIPRWNVGDTTSYIKAKTTGNYILSLFDTKKNICSTSDTIFIVFQNPKIVNIGNDTTLCNEGNIELNATLSGAKTYSWNTGSNSPTIQTTNNRSTYTVAVYDGVCTVRDSITVDHYDIIELTANDTTYCDLTNAVYTINAPNSTNVMWKSLITNEQGATSSFNCNLSDTIFAISAYIYTCVTLDTVSMNFKTTPIIGFPSDTAFCDTLMGSLQPQESAEAYFWSSGNINKTEQIESEGLVWLTANNGICTARDSVQVSFQNTPDLSFIFEDTTICESGKILEFDYNFLTEDLLWENGSTLGYRAFSNNGNHRLIATNDCGADTASFTLSFLDGMCYVYIPNAFTPNGNNRNDNFKPISALPEAAYKSFYVYNSIGTIVYKGTGWQGWDGTYKGKPAMQDTYFYTFQYLFNGKFEYREGMVQLLR